MITLALLLACQATAADTEAPLIEDVAAAASNPDAAPVITVMLSDRGSAVGTALVHFRKPGGEWRSVELRGGASGVFLARLPDGTQRTGFEYWIEASDVAGNGPARVASPDRPLVVDGAVEPTLQRLARERAEAGEPSPGGIHPAWLMLSLGTGVAAGAGAGAFALDVWNVQRSIDREQPSGERLQRLEEARTIDIIVATSLGVVAVAGLATGVVLTVLASTE